MPANKTIKLQKDSPEHVSQTHITWAFELTDIRGHKSASHNARNNMVLESIEIKNMHWIYVRKYDGIEKPRKRKGLSVECSAYVAQNIILDKLLYIGQLSRGNNDDWIKFCIPQKWEFIR